MPLNYKGIKRSLSCTNLSSMSNEDAHDYDTDSHYRKDIENTWDEKEQPLKKARTLTSCTSFAMVSPELAPATAAVLKLASLDDCNDNEIKCACVSGDDFEWRVNDYAQHVPVSPLGKQAGTEVQFTHNFLGAITNTSKRGQVSRSVSPIEELEAACANAPELPPLAFQPSRSVIDKKSAKRKKFCKSNRRVQTCRISNRLSSPTKMFIPLPQSIGGSSSDPGGTNAGVIRRQCSSFNLSQLTADMARIMSN
eukprot:CAMPEP_0196809680 /NCGR_PEP_ID=MMETSP1362-20130617/9587_1 /TAXON_ID=163516 /ORGANISM="Leptocylindrus danicus, Strain CCMP1856" /LENGTH=251 /DNA_ID=CAMNT_0042184437 /DNA_START=251 /DNA_END=1006 /DNA_ORIENTATION=+